MTHNLVEAIVTKGANGEIEARINGHTMTSMALQQQCCLCKHAKNSEDAVLTGWMVYVEE